MELSNLSQSTVFADGMADVAATRERSRLGRVGRLAAVLAGVAVWSWWRVLDGSSIWPGLPNIPIQSEYVFPIILILVLGIALLGPLLGAGR